MREVESCPTGSRSMPRRRRVHIMREGREVATEEDEPGAGSRKHALGEASRSGLKHFTVSCGVDEPKIDLFTIPDLCDCHLIGTEEEHRFLAGTYRWICMPEVEFLMSYESVDHLTEDVKVAGDRAIILAQAARRRHGHVETELKERVASSEKEKADLRARNKELSGQVGSLEASIARNKALVEDAEACMSHNVDLCGELKKMEDLEK